MPTRPLPNDPSLEHLRKQAKRLRAAVRAGDADALAKVGEFHPRRADAVARFKLSDAQLVVARGYGFASWPQVKQFFVAIEPFVWNPPPPDPSASVDVFLRLACLTYAGWHRSNPDKARRMLAERPEVARENVYAAAAAGDADAVRREIDRHPALVNAKGGPLKWEPLLYACYSRIDGWDPRCSTLDVARLLLSRGADPNAGFLYSGSYAFTALTGAFGRGEDWHNQPPHPHGEALATLLLEAGADPNDSQALYNRHFEANDDHLRLLFAYGLGQEKGGPWLKRMTGESSGIGTMLVQHLCWAASHGFLDRVRLLVDHGVDVNGRSPRSGRTAYEEAMRAGHPGIAEYLVQRGAKWVELDARETFALACVTGRVDDVRARLASDPVLLDRLGHGGRVELLDRTVSARQFEVVRLLVEHGVDINGMVPGTGHDRAALHNAAGWGGLETVKFLLSIGADPHLRDTTFHAAPIGWALHNNQRDVVEYLLPFASIFDAVQCGAVGRVAEILKANPADAGSRDAAGNPVVFYLHERIERLEEMIHLLESHGADLNATSRNGKTVLDRALANGSLDFADVLRRHGGVTSAERV